MAGPMGESRRSDIRPRSPEFGWDDKRGCYMGETAVRIRYAETDRMGIAYNAHYLTWFEIGRTEFMRSAGFPYRQMEERGINLPLVETAFRLRASVSYDDVLITQTWIHEVRSRTVAFAYEILHGGRVVAEGHTKHAFVRAADGKSTVCPTWLRPKLDELTA